MNIAFDAKRAFHNNRGLGNYSRDLIRILQEHRVGKLYLFNPKPAKTVKVTLGKDTLQILPQSFFWRKLKSLWRSVKITDIARRLPIDIYHGLSGEIPKGISKYVPTVVTIHDLIFMRYPQLYSFFDRKIHYRKFKYAAQKAHRIIAISEQTKRDIVQFLGVTPEKIEVVYQGCHQAFKETYTEAEKAAVRAKYHLPERFVLNVGAIEPRKNALEIVKAIQPLDISLVLVGQQTAYYNQIEAYCKAHNLSDRVLALRGVSMQELAMIYQLAEVFCYPSVFEGFGIPIIEALFSKTPVITSQGSCFAEAGGAHSIYVNLENAAAEIREAIVRIQADEALRTTMVNEGYAYAQRFTDEAVFAHLMKVYEGLLPLNATPKS